MNIKKRLEKRIRGWLPKEPVLKAPPKSQMTRVNRSLRFKVGRWFHGTSAFVSSLLGQISLRTKITVLALGIVVFSDWLLYFLTVRNFVSDSVLHWGAKISLYSCLLLAAVGIPYDYFRRRKYLKNHPSENINPSLILGGTIAWGISVAILGYSMYLMDFASTLESASTIPFYLSLVGILMLFVGMGLSYLGQRRNEAILNSLIHREHERIVVSEKIDVNEKIMPSSRLGYMGGFLLAALSILQLISSKEGFFWWNVSGVYGAVVIVSGMIGLAAGIIGSYGAFVGKKLGGKFMISSGILGLLCAPIYGVVFGSLLIAGGTVALLERPYAATTVD